MKTIVIVPGDNGPGFDLASYLRNELAAKKLRGAVYEVDVGEPVTDEAAVNTTLPPPEAY